MASTAPSSSAYSRPTLPNPPLRLLIVDDQPTVRKGLAAFLAFSTHIQIIGEAENGNQALSLARAQLPDVVVMDLEMPLLDGIEATRRIRELGLPIHVIVLSAHPELYERALEAGADAFMAKGEPLEHLVLLLEQWLPQPIQRSTLMTYAPVQYFVLAFPDNQFKGEIVPALQDVVSKGLIRIVDLAFATKDAQGNLDVMEVNALETEEFNAFAELLDHTEGLLSDDDIRELAAAIPANNSAALLVLEHTWGTRLAQAFRDAHADVIAEGYVSQEIVAQVMPTRIAPSA